MKTNYELAAFWLRWAWRLAGLALFAVIAFPATLSYLVNSGHLTNHEGTAYMLTGLMFGGATYLVLQLFFGWACYAASAALKHSELKTAALTVLGLLPTLCFGAMAYLWFDLRRLSGSAES